MISLFKNLLLTSVLLLCPVAAQERFEGESMGTTWQVTISAGTIENPSELIKRELDLVDTLMSTWRSDSEISRFNAYAETDWFEVSKETAQVVEAANRVSKATDGAFDVTVSPLIDLWNFDRNTDRERVPTAEEIAALQGRIGWKLLSVRTDPPALRKANPLLAVNLSAIAKGYAVDRVTSALMAAGVEACLVEVGGEVQAIGQSSKGKPWAIGIEEPIEGVRAIRSVASLENQSMATSGDYRNFYVVDGKRYSHTIDPRTGSPIEHDVASVTIVTESCMEADAWATAINVLGPEAGPRLLERLDLTGVLTTRVDDGFTDTVVGNFPLARPSDPVAPVVDPPTSMWPVFLAAAIVFLLAVTGMAAGVIISNRRLKGSCGGLAGMTDSAGQTACDLCAIPSAECRGDAAEKVT